MATWPGLAEAAGLLAARIVIGLVLFVLAFVMVEAWRPDLAAIAWEALSR